MSVRMSSASSTRAIHFVAICNNMRCWSGGIAGSFA
jgi:hypothetical protein